MVVFVVLVLVSGLKSNSPAAMTEWATSLGWSYQAKKVRGSEALPDMNQARLKLSQVMQLRSGVVTAMVSGHTGGTDFVAANILVGAGRSSHVYGVYVIPLPGALPELEITRQGLGTKIATTFGGQDIEVGYEPFDQRFRVRSDNEGFARTALTPALTMWMADLAKDDPLVDGAINIIGSTAFLVTIRPIDPTQIPVRITALASLVDRFPVSVWIPVLGAGARSTHLAGTGLSASVPGPKRSIWDGLSSHIVAMSVVFGLGLSLAILLPLFL
jgi:hypothetical protein